MTSEFERSFYKVSVYQASINILSERGNNEPTLCEVLELVKNEQRKARSIPHSISKVYDEAAVIRAHELRRVLQKDPSCILEKHDYQKGVKLLEIEMKRKRLNFRRF